MGLNLSKGDKLDLSKKGGLNLEKDMVFGLGFSGKNGRSLDLDSYVAVLDSENKPIEFIYFSNLNGQGIRHNGDDTRGGGKETDPNETIKVNLSKLDSRANTLVIGLFIYSGASNLGDVKSAFTNLISSTGQEVCRYNVKEQFSKYSSVVVAEVTKSGDTWEYSAVGKGSSEKYRDIKNKYTSRRTVSTGGGYSGSSTENNKSWWQKLLGL